MSRFCEGGLDALLIEDDAALHALPDLPWAALRGALAEVRFAWPEDADAAPGAWEDIVRQANLLRWHPAGDVELLRGPEVGADELCHLAVHRLLYQALGAPEGWPDWLFIEAVASAGDVLLLGGLLRQRTPCAFVELQAGVWADCWADAGRDEGALEAAFLALADDPVAAFRAIVTLIEAHVGALLTGAPGLLDAAEGFAERVATPWGPLLLHFQTAWWAGALRSLPATASPQLAEVREAVLSSDAPFEVVLQLVSALEDHAGEALEQTGRVV